MEFEGSSQRDHLNTEHQALDDILLTEQDFEDESDHFFGQLELKDEECTTVLLRGTDEENPFEECTDNNIC